MNYVFKTFECGNEFFVYDRNCNKILSISKQEYDSLNNPKSLEREKVLSKYQDRGFLKDSNLKEIEHPASAVLAEFEDKHIHEMILQVTQDCNLRCSYCYYVNERYRQRHHSHIKMEFSLAKRAMDYFMEHSSDEKEIVLGFYGGEPLLCFDLIKKCVEYMELNVQGRKVRFVLTTNGTLLTNEKIEYFIEHDISILISLDGSKESHDYNRKFADGTGSFDIIINKIKNLKENYPDYFKTVLFNTVISPEMDMNKIRKYYEADEVLKDAQIMSGTIQEFYASEPPRYDDKLFIDSCYGQLKAILFCAGRLKEEDLSILHRGYIGNYKKMLQSLQSEFVLPPKFHHGGPCIAGSKRLFVDISGRLFPCEHVSEESAIMEIGSIDKGIIIEKIDDLINVGKITEKECLNCWALVQCRICAAWADDLSTLNRNKKLSVCPKYRESVLEDMKTICMLKRIQQY